MGTTRVAEGEEEEADGSTHICDDTLTEKLSQVRREGKNTSLLKKKKKKSPAESLIMRRAETGEGERTRGEEVGMEKEQQRVTQMMGREQRSGRGGGDDEGFSSTIGGTQVRGSKQGCWL